MNVAVAIFTISLAVCVYLYVGYPALVFVLARLRGRPIRQSDDAQPSMTVIIPAFNEAATIDEKLRNTLALDYPPDRFEAVVVSDGSTDGTAEIARRYAGPRARVLDLPRGGKARALNAGVEDARGEILVFTDANSLLEPDAMRHLARNFADPEVGGVCGNKRYRASAGDATAEGEGLYWRYDKWQKQQETRIGSIFAADGTLHAVRRALYVPIDDPAQADDIAISTRVVLQGSRLVYEPAAVAWEEAPVEGRDEFHRKIRVTNHSVRALLNLRGALWRSGFYSVELISHKLLRHFAPFFLLPLLISNVVLAPVHPLFAVILALQVFFYGLALAGVLLRATPAGRLRVITVPYYFTLVNAAAFLGVLSILRGHRQHSWTPRHGLQALLAVTTLMGLPGGAAAQDRVPVDAQVRFNASFHDNFFQAARNAPTDNVWVRAFEARVARKSTSRGQPLPFGRFDFVSYSGLDPAVALRGGVTREDNRSAYTIEAGVQWNRPRFDIGDGFEYADIVGVDGEYSARVTPAIELKALGELFHETYELRTTNTNNQFNFGGGVRYRGFGSDFSPEVGWLWGGRDAETQDEDFGQRQFYLQVRSAAVRSTYLSVRFRRRFRDYSSESGSNFGREDRRYQLTAYGDVTVTPNVVINLSYWYERANSTRDTRDFSAQAIGFGATYRF
jgi:cellulose synthase/poly-beta-1,6-N-acetylglucosamine synthase-like glycosyltransferase